MAAGLAVRCGGDLCERGGDGTEGGVLLRPGEPVLVSGARASVAHLRGAGAELVLRPMLLGAVHKAAGVTAPIEVPSKGRYQVRDIHRWAEHYGLTMRFPEPFPFRTLKTMRAAVVRLMEGDLETFVREAFVLYWEEGGAPKGLREEDEDGPLREVAVRIGADPEEVLNAPLLPKLRKP